ncbi:hypothetical protein [Streptomyces sp. NPDC006552]|uniref:hypothetical protein n=1 Tax=Streptomyces sp. NPDC006552 TaxID=3157179 RepID=UPI0033B3E3DD
MPSPSTAAGWCFTSNARLDTFPERIGADSSALERNERAIAARDRSVADREFSGRGPWYGLTHARKKPSPTESVVVNRSDPDRPMVFVVSTHP